MLNTVPQPSRNLLAVAIAVAVLFGATSAVACQIYPQTVVQCDIVPERPIVKQGETFKVFVTVTNNPTSGVFPPPYFDDTAYEINTSVDFGQCLSVGGPATADITPATYIVNLDDAWSPFVDEPTSNTTELLVTPTSTGGHYAINSSICTLGFPNCARACYPSTCVEIVDDPTQYPTPSAEFIQPHQGGNAGGVLPFQLRILRNAYTKGVPLTVRVLPENRSDPIDIFPLSPESLSTTGYVVNGDEELIDFQCSLHYPCFVGVDNIYHVTIHAGSTLLWETRTNHPNGIGRATVTRSPMVRQELVEIRDQGGDGVLAVGEQAEVLVRLYARNPYHDAALDNGILKTLIPAGLVFKSAVFQKHDNPMDTYDPTPAELAAFGTIVSSAGDFEVTFDNPLAPRFTGSPPHGIPVTFDDMFEVLLTLETTPGGYPAPTTIVFPGLDFAADYAGDPRGEISAPFSIDVNQPQAPNVIDGLYVVKQLPNDVVVTWTDPSIDVTHGAATGYKLYRAMQTPLSYVEIADQPDTTAATEQYLDLGALSPSAPFDPLHFYRQSCYNGDGTSGDEP